MKGHVCALCYMKGHHPKFCPNLAWAIMFGAIKKFIPSAVRNHVAQLRNGYDVKMNELQGFIEPAYLRKMTAAYADGPMPAALRGTPFTDEQFEKASKSWTNLQRKIKDNPRGGGKSVRSGASSSTYSKRTAAVADLGSDEEGDNELDDQDDGSYVDESSEGEK